MTTQINRQNNFMQNFSHYFHTEMTCENLDASVTIVRGAINYVNVTVKNASHRAWKGAGKNFNNLKDALNNYKDPRVKDMIYTAQILSE